MSIYVEAGGRGERPGGGWGRVADGRGRLYPLLIRGFYVQKIL
jgi:hypothetical protein